MTETDSNNSNLKFKVTTLISLVVLVFSFYLLNNAYQQNIRLLYAGGEVKGDALSRGNVLQQKEESTHD